MRQQKVYRVEIGFADKWGDHTNMSSTNVMAPDALSAAKKPKLGKGEYVAEVQLIAVIDEPR